MVVIRTGVAAALVGLLVAAPALAQKGKAPGAPTALAIDGSSTVYPFSLAAIDAFAKRGGSGARITAKATGTSAGFRQFCNGSLAVAAASRPINSKELKACSAAGVTFLELPISFDAITVVVNPANSWAKQISTAELKRLWERSAQGRIKRWNQVNAAWPNQPIRLCAPGQDSGTYDTFNKAINGDEANARRDVTSSEDDDVLVSCVANDKLALGYFGYDYYQPNRSKLKALAVIGPRGAATPSAASVQQSRYIPLSRPLFYYVNEASLQRSAKLRAFISNTIEQGGKIARKAGTIPLEDATYRLVSSKLYRNVQGTAFGGELPIGLTIGQILDRSFDAQKRPQYR